MALHVLLAWDGGRVITSAFPDLGPWLGPVCWAIYAVFAVAAAAVAGVRTGLGDRPTSDWARLAWPLVAASLPFLLFGYNLDSASVVPVLVVGLPLIALNEELFFRGVLLGLLQPSGLRSAVIWSSVAFGASHLANLVAGVYPPFVAMQVAATTAGGVALAAIRIRTGSLWPCLVVHLLIDLIAVSTLTGPATSSPLLLPILFGWLAANLALWRYGWHLIAAQAGNEPTGSALLPIVSP